LEDLLARLRALKNRAAIVGPKGSGKTTLLEDLEGPLSTNGQRVIRLRLTAHQPRFSQDARQRLLARLDSRDILLLDGAEPLGPIAWHRFLWQTRRAAGIIITTHRPGRLPVLYRCSTSPGLLHGILETLLGDGPLADPQLATDLYHRHRGNLRDALREMYDRYKDERLRMKDEG